MMRGELVHIPQGTILLEGASDDVERFLTLDRPHRALFWEDIGDYSSWTGTQSQWCRVFYKGQMWMVKKKSVYPLTTQE